MICEFVLDMNLDILYFILWISLHISFPPGALTTMAMLVTIVVYRLLCFTQAGSLRNRYGDAPIMWSICGVMVYSLHSGGSIQENATIGITRILDQATRLLHV